LAAAVVELRVVTEDLELLDQDLLLHLFLAQAVVAVELSEITEAVMEVLAVVPLNLLRL
jgi:2-phospho-L-lactate transferase/gluconeogenesis factor (CofD/UPF0052 family)